MPRVCKTCQRPDIDAINRDLTNDVTVRNIMAKYKGLSLGGIDRHKHCIEELFAEVRNQKRAGLLSSVDEVRQEIIEVKAEFPDNPNVRLGLIGKMLDVIDKEAKLTGAYIDAKKNPADVTIYVETIRKWQADRGKTNAQAIEKATEIELQQGFVPGTLTNQIIQVEGVQ